MTDNPLGKKTAYPDTYSPDVLFAIPRSEGRAQLDFTGFDGYDVWNAFEFSYLTLSGKPVARRLIISYTADSPNIVESKSLKLYLGSFSQAKFADNEVIRRIHDDLTSLLQADVVSVQLYDHNAIPAYDTFSAAVLIDDLDVACSIYSPDSALLRVKQEKADYAVLVSHLLKTNCPITGQPDWGSVLIGYSGEQSIDEASLLRYIVSFRNHAGYHEQCCEQIFSDIYTAVKPYQLTVACFYTRRGGIDINPVRYLGDPILPVTNFHTWRQ